MQAGSSIIITKEDLLGKSRSQLTDLLRDRGLKTTGVKDAMINRLLKLKMSDHAHGRTNSVETCTTAADMSRPTETTTHPIYCCVPECHTNSADIKITGETMHRLPSGPSRRTIRRQWVAKLKTVRANLILTDGTRVCSNHFNPGDFNSNGTLLAEAIPTVFPTKPEPLKTSRKRPMDRNPEQHNIATKDINISMSISTQTLDGPTTCDFGCQVSLSDINIDDLRDDNAKTRFFTGFLNFATFMVILNTLIKHGRDRLNYWGREESHKDKSFHGEGDRKKPGPQRKLDMPTEFLATMMWYRLGLLEDHLASIFKVSTSTISRIVTTWSQFIYEHSVGIVSLPSKLNVLNNMPHHFINHPNVYIVFDCTEFFMEKPSGLEAQNLTWSEYKHHNTLKVLVGVTPDGLTSIVTKPWGGRASDRHIVWKEDVLKLIPDGMSVMADKGFEVEDMLPPGINLIMPPKVSTKSQMSDYEFFKTVEVAEPRIVVEMKMEQAKNYQILQNVFPISRIATAHQVIYNCFAFTNLLPQLFVTQQDSDQSVNLPIFK